jgi:NAD(P)-dependent dehydrogenase (short-subunit alcohol dehydrogenase family)
LVNCAAIDTRPDAPAEDNGPFENLVEQVFDATMAVNVKGVVLCCQVFGGAMARAGLGSIVNIASIYGMVAPDQDIYQYRRDQGDVFYKPIGYSVSKSALYNLTRYLAVYWGKQQVRVNTLTLGGVKNLQDQRFIEKYEAKVPLGRMAQPEDYVGAVAFLMSDASRYLTGANIVIDGGYTAL